MNTPAQHSERDYLVDNLKTVLITLVVIGHFIEPYINQAIYFKVLFLCIYCFHMPVFVFLSGYLSKSANSLNPSKAVASLLLPYLIFSLLWRLREHIHTQSFDFNILSPTFHLWYLLSLFTWKLVLPALKSVKYYIPLSFFIALAAGLSSSVDNDFSLGRTLSLLPFFVLGTVCSSSMLYEIKKRRYLVISGLFAFAFITYATLHYNFNFRIIGWVDAYHVAGYRYSTGLLARGVLIVLSLITGLAVIAATPSKKGWLTVIGSRTIVIYIFHGFLVKPFAVRFPVWHSSLLNDAVILSFPFMVILMLSMPFVYNFYNRVIGFIARKVLA